MCQCFFQYFCDTHSNKYDIIPLWEVTLMTVGEKIKYFRTLHGFTQDQLVQATGLGISTLQKYESDERKPKSEQLLKISQALGISINVFMDFDIHTVSDLLSLIFKMNEQLDLNFSIEKDGNGNVIPDTLTLSFGNPLINQKLSAYITFLNQIPDTDKEQYTQSLIEFENKLLDDNTEIHKAAASATSFTDISSSAFSDPSYQKLQNLLSDCTPQELEWILKSAQLIKNCIRDTK